MGFMDDAMKKVKKAKDQATKAVADNEDKIDGAIDKVAGAADGKLKGKHRDKVAKAADAAKKGVDKIAGDKGGEGGGGGAPGAR
ncbi:Rv0909 family putative TA system antitoxin [Actinomarinicola tropica]|uniref:Antitoxin n=1 Tax=Actinomarinicola tropica TaxID=2789776 RepID=A0A5Q2RD46_9ACTN|nr:Rv0909 family putative TA system antitoxin [Actinomarinicola tropica]QGG94778.1 antitoxin [Actinomarinicola tropica]